MVSDQFLRADREQSHGVVLGERVQFARCAFDLSDDDRDVFVGFDLLHVIYDLNKTPFLLYLPAWLLDGRYMICVLSGLPREAVYIIWLGARTTEEG